MGAHPVIATAEGSVALRDIVARLGHHYGEQAWWPAESPFEMALGAVLVQHTQWTNAAQALTGLRAAPALAPDALLALDADTLERLLRPSGTFRIKARRVRALARWWLDERPHRIGASTAALRASLLGVHGIGPETADCILVYAFARPVFVADAYARHLFSRLGMDVITDGGYETLRVEVERRLPADAGLLGEAHALVVAHGKAHCGARPRCVDCVLAAPCQQVGVPR